MPARLFKRINLDLLYPPFLERLLEVVAECEGLGVDYHVYFGFRSFASQAKLRQDYLEKRGGMASPPGYSAHQYGLAADLAPDGDKLKPGLQPVWTPEAFGLLGHVAQKHGLVWGGAWKKPDAPHVQWPGFVTGSELATLRNVWIASREPDDLSRLRECWSHVSNVTLT